MPSILPPSGVRERAARVLLVEDDRDSAEVLAAILVAEGHDVAVALDAAEALATVEEFTPDLALIDLGLPGANGVEVAAALRGNSRLRSCKFIAVTGYTGEEVKRAIQGAGFQAYMTKPLDLELLLRMVGAVGRNRKSG